MIIDGVVKGDTINLELSIGQNITGWKIRCEIYDDCGHCIKLATANSGGSNSQIEITNATEGEFTIKVAKELTTLFEDKSRIEIEVENTNAEVFTPIVGEENEIRFKKQQISWSTPA
jgi:hypothetical protein